MLQDAQRTSAPSATSVSIRTAVWMVMCSEPATRAPLSGFVSLNSSRIAIRPGISVSAMVISMRPQLARPMSFTEKSPETSFNSTPLDLLLALMIVLPLEPETGR